MKPLQIGKRRAGDGVPPLLVAEIAQNHDGSLGTAHAYVDAVADAGADAVKFQTHIAVHESTLDEPFRVAFSRQDKTRYDYWTRMEFSEEQWAGLAAHARERGLEFISSAFSTAAVELLARVGVSCWKLAAGEFLSFDILDAMAVDGKPVLLSTGMCTWAEIEALVAYLDEKETACGILQCTSRYPVAFREVGLNLIESFRKRFHRPVGLSDHSGSVYPGLAAMALGADLVEVHVTLDRRAFGPDVKASVTVDDLAMLARARDAFSDMHANPVDKDRMAESLHPMRDLFSKSVAPSRALPAGTVLTNDMLTAKKPGSGIPAVEKSALIGRRLTRAVVPERLLRQEDLEPKT